MANNWQINAIAGLDDTQSRNQLNSDIKKLEGNLNKLKLYAEIDKNQVTQLQHQLKNLQVQLNNVTVSDAVINGLVAKINAGLQNVNISNVNIDNIGNQARQTGEKIAQQINQGINSVVQKGSFEKIFTPDKNGINGVAKDAEKYFKTLSNTVSVEERLGNKNNLEGFTVTLKNAEGVVEQLRYKYQELKNDAGEVTSRWFEYSGGSINDNGVIKQMNAISTKADSLQTKLDKLKANYSDVNASRPIKDSGNISALSQQYDKVAQAIENVRSADNSTFSSMVSNAQKEITTLETMVSQFRNAENVATQMKSVDISSGIAQAQERLGKLKANASGFEQMTEIIGKLDTAIKGVGDKASLDKFINDLRTAETQLGRVKAEAKQLENVNKIQLSWSDGSYEAKYDSIIAKTRQWVDTNDESVISTQKLTQAYNEFNTAASNFAKDGGVKNRDILIQKEEELGRQLKSTTNDIKVQNAEWAKSSKVDSLHQKIQEFYDKNSATHRQWGGQLQNLLNETAHGAQVTATRVNEIEQEFLGVSNAARQAGKLGQSFFGGMIEQAKKFANWVSVTTLLMRGFQELKQGVQFIRELDDALTDVAYTSNSSKSRLEDLGNSAVQMSKDLKASADNILEAVKIYSTAKSSADDILRKAQPAIMLSNISGMSGSESSKTINTALNQFELEDTEEGLLDITDTLQYVSSQLNYDFTEGIQQITEGLEASGSVAMNAGLSFQEYSAMVGLAVEKTGQAGSTIGQAYKTIFSRITKASATEGTLDEDISAAEKSLRSVGIQVRDSANEFRDLTDIMADLGKVWNSLSSVEKSNIGYNIAGIRQLNILNSLFGSWEGYASIMGDIDERTGTTLKNQEVYAESLAGHLGELEAVGQSVWNNIIQSKTLKSGIDLLTGLLNIVDKTTDALGGLGTVGLAGGLLAGIKNVGGLKFRESHFEYA